MEINSRDELGELAQSLNSFLDRLRSIIVEVVASSARITQEADQVAASADSTVQAWVPEAALRAPAWCFIYPNRWTT